MRTIGVIAAQVFLSLLVTGVILPPLAAYSPRLTGSAIGPWLPFLAVAFVFVLLRLAWPRRNQTR